MRLMNSLGVVSWVGETMRPCIARLGPGDLGGSNSHAQLAYSNEILGRNMFKCSTIIREGWCLGAECDLFLQMSHRVTIGDLAKRGNIVLPREKTAGKVPVVVRRGGLGAEPPMGVAGAEPPAVSSSGLSSWSVPGSSTKQSTYAGEWGPLPLPLGRERSRLKRLERREVS